MPFRPLFALLFVSACAHAQSLQERIDAHPGEAILLAGARIEVNAALRIIASGTHIAGPGTIVQTNPDVSIIEIAGANEVVVENVTLMRAPGHEETTQHGIHARDGNGIEIRAVRVIDNRSPAGTIYLENCRNSVVKDCLVRNYKRVTVDDRTASDLYGYAFRVIDGTGILVNRGTDILISDNRVIDENLLPTPGMKEKHGLGQLCEGAHPTNKGKLAPKGDYANNWHQGSAITVTDPLNTTHVTVRGNFIVNAAQGIDLHADNILCTGNQIDHAFIGIKCMHGAQDVIISDNNISHVDLWGIVMMPGTASHTGKPAHEGNPAQPANLTRGNIIANNVFSHFGHGHEYWNWKDNTTAVISLESGQLAENPVMRDVIVSGNMIHDPGQDGVLQADGSIAPEPPRYKYAIYMTPEPRPQDIFFSGNVFHPGSVGVSNIPLE